VKRVKKMVENGEKLSGRVVDLRVDMKLGRGFRERKLHGLWGWLKEE